MSSQEPNPKIARKVLRDWVTHWVEKAPSGPPSWIVFIRQNKASLKYVLVALFAVIAFGSSFYLVSESSQPKTQAPSAAVIDQTMQRTSPTPSPSP